MAGLTCTYTPCNRSSVNECLCINFSQLPRSTCCTLLCFECGPTRLQTSRTRSHVTVRRACSRTPATVYTSIELRRPADTEARQRLRSASSMSLAVLRTRLTTVGNRAFPIASAHLWNSLPSHATTTISLTFALILNATFSRFPTPISDLIFSCSVPAQ